jgi:hypothetical protein
VRRGRLSIAAIAAVLLGLVFAGSASACSCVRSTPAESLARSDAAVVGRLLAVEPIGTAPPGAGEGRFEYRILRVYRGATLRRGAILTLRSSLSGAACGLPQRIGRRYGLFLGRAGGRWQASLCSVVAPDRLRAAAQSSGAPARGSAVPLNCAG